MFSCFGGVVNVLASHDLKEATNFPPSWEYSNLNISLRIPSVSNLESPQNGRYQRRKVVDVIFEPGALYEEGSGISAIPVFWARFHGPEMFHRRRSPTFVGGRR